MKTNIDVHVCTSFVHSQEQHLPALQSGLCGSLADPAYFVPNLLWMPSGEQHCSQYLRKSEQAVQV